MLILLQRVTHAQVVIKNESYAQISQGLLLLCGFKADDTIEHCLQLLEKSFKYRVFSDEKGKMNRSLIDCNGEALLVPQFTLVADSTRGLRPSFSKGMPANKGSHLFTEIVQRTPKLYSRVAFGQFAADMQVSLCNDGPVTFILEN